MLPDWIEEEVKRADEIALQARAAAEAGDQEKAAALREEFEMIHSALELQYSIARAKGVLKDLKAENAKVDHGNPA